ncbi:hypothetical protein [Vibrio breoganii]|uniref:hypothetical protein n=1 Tax=Vibrio breoganii TaxID=553239 RepID=UPI0021C47A90|nr:hypothetical protein [Vibrio breoganii]MDN3717768.1 hypothetical protein [Vibrio breoganii]
MKKIFLLLIALLIASSVQAYEITPMDVVNANQIMAKMSGTQIDENLTINSLEMQKLGTTVKYIYVYDSINPITSENRKILNASHDMMYLSTCQTLYDTGGKELLAASNVDSLYVELRYIDQNNNSFITSGGCPQQ